MPATAQPQAVWNVTVDAEGDLRATPVDPAAVASLVDILAEYGPAVSHLPRRFSTRLSVVADGPLEAASEAIEVWRAAVADAQLPDWPVARLEVARARR